MHIAVYLPLLAAALLGAGAPVLAHRLPPATATRLLVTAGVLSSAATSFVLAVLAFLLVAQLPPVAALGPWSVPALAATNPVPVPATAAAAAAVCVLAVLAVRAAVRWGRALVAARALCLRLGGGPGQLILVDGGADVFAVPAARGRIVAARPLLRALPAGERRALLAHETAHLDHHHHRYRLAADLAAAVNPMLRPLAAAVRYATERWADETAAAATGDRALVARALARAGVHRASARRPPAVWTPAVLDMAASQVARRVQALLGPPPRPRPTLVVAVVALLAVTVTATVEAQQDTERLFERAMTASSPLTPGASSR